MSVNLKNNVNSGDAYFYLLDDMRQVAQAVWKVEHGQPIFDFSVYEKMYANVCEQVNLGKQQEDINVKHLRAYRKLGQAIERFAPRVDRAAFLMQSNADLVEQLRRKKTSPQQIDSSDLQKWGLGLFGGIVLGISSMSILRAKITDLGSQTEELLEIIKENDTGNIIKIKDLEKKLSDGIADLKKLANSNAPEPNHPLLQQLSEQIVSLKELVNNNSPKPTQALLEKLSDELVEIRKHSERFGIQSQFSDHPHCNTTYAENNGPQGFLDLQKRESPLKQSTEESSYYDMAVHTLEFVKSPVFSLLVLSAGFYWIAYHAIPNAISEKIAGASPNEAEIDFSTLSPMEKFTTMSDEAIAVSRARLINGAASSLQTFLMSASAERDSHTLSGIVQIIEALGERARLLRNEE